MHRQEGYMAKCVQEMQVWQRARELGIAVNAILEIPRLKNDRRLHEQLSDASDSVISNIAEGFEQPTDKAFVRYLYISQSSNAELRTRLQVACDRRLISDEQFTRGEQLASEVARMITGLIKYLSNCNRKNRRQGRPRDNSQGTDNSG
jgi:four helix bundle protein